MSTRLISLYLAQQREANARRAREANTGNGDSHTVTFTTTHVQDAILNSHLETSVLTMQEDVRPDNTQRAMDPKAKEFFIYCDLKYLTDPFKYILSYQMIYKFMYYQSFREQKNRGGKKGDKVVFNVEVYDELVAQFAGSDPDSVEALNNYPRPTKPIGKATFDLYKAVFRKLYKVQQARNVLSLHWDSLWQMGLDEMAAHVKVRAPKVKRATYQEKVDGEFAPYIIVEQYNGIEELLWNDSNVVSCRMIATRLRHRYCCLHLTSGILRCESLHKAEWSDFLGITIPKKVTDIDEMYCMINQIPLGKTNHGRVLYRREG
jgi:hypothetical protein